MGHIGIGMFSIGIDMFSIGIGVGHIEIGVASYGDWCGIIQGLVWVI